MARFSEFIVILIFIASLGFILFSAQVDLAQVLSGNDVDPLADKPKIIIDELEKEIHRLVNAERTKRSLAPLSWDEKLRIIAREHSKDMAQQNFFDHVNPDGETPTERGLAKGYNCTRYYATYKKTGVAENIYQNNLYTTYDYRGDSIVSYNWSTNEEIAKSTVEGWMKSDYHRKNILDKNHGSEGIGVYIDDNHKVWITENFC